MNKTQNAEDHELEEANGKESADADSEEEDHEHSEKAELLKAMASEPSSAKPPKKNDGPQIEEID